MHGMSGNGRTQRPVDNRFINGTTAALRSCLLKNVPTIVCIYICRIRNPDIPQASRYGAAHGGTAGPGRDGQHRTPTGRFAQEKNAPLTFQEMEKQFPGRASGGTNKGNPVQTDGGTKQGVDPRFISRTRSAVCSWILTSVLLPFRPSKPF